MKHLRYPSWLAEKQSVMLYQALAAKESNPRFQHLFSRLAEAADDQARIWEQQITADGSHVPTHAPTTLRTRIILALIHAFGARPLLSVLAAAKVRGLSVYTSHLVHHETPLDVAEVGKRHSKSAAGGNLRASVFGINDGLVSNAALIFGMAGASSLDVHLVLMAGVAGLLAGAFSMAAGEYISVRAQRDMFEYQIGLEAEELKLYPEEEAMELALIYEARGLDKTDALALARRLVNDPAKALDTLAREELGVDPSELASPLQAALFSFLAFSFGALVPLMPFVLGAGSQGFVAAIIATGGALFLTGATVSLFTGKAFLASGLRMLLIGAAAATATFYIGKLLEHLTV